MELGVPPRRPTTVSGYDETVAEETQGSRAIVDMRRLEIVLRAGSMHHYSKVSPVFG